MDSQLLQAFNDPGFNFKPDTHEYTYKGEKYQSVTSYTKKFFEPFYSEEVAKKYGAKHGISPKIVQQEWKEKAQLGTNVHELIELFLNHGIKNRQTASFEEMLRFARFYHIFEGRLKDLELCATELQVFSHEFKIAGTIDAVFKTKGQHVLVDWKTNKNFKTDNDFCFGKKLYPPFQAHKDNELNKYSLQLSLYRLILEEHGFSTRWPVLVHISETEARIYQAKDFREELKKELTSYTQTVQ